MSSSCRNRAAAKCPCRKNLNAGADKLRLQAGGALQTDRAAVADKIGKYRNIVGMKFLRYVPAHSTDDDRAARRTRRRNEVLNVDR